MEATAEDPVANLGCVQAELPSVDEGRYEVPNVSFIDLLPGENVSLHTFPAHVINLFPKCR